MTKQDIIRMGRESGIGDCHLPNPHPGVVQQLERFAAIVAAAEREACAKVCEAAGPDAGPVYCAFAIRVRGNT